MTEMTYNERVDNVFNWIKTHRSPEMVGYLLNAMKEATGKSSVTLAALLNKTVADDELLERVELFLEAYTKNESDAFVAPKAEVAKDDLLAIFGIEHPELCHRCQSAAKERGDYCESCAAIIDAEIAKREVEQRAEDEASGAAFIEARKAGKPLDEQYAAYEQVKSSRGGARPGAGHKPTPDAFDQRSYQAGYKAGKRAKKAYTVIYSGISHVPYTETFETAEAAAQFAEQQRGKGYFAEVAEHLAGQPFWLHTISAEVDDAGEMHLTIDGDSSKYEVEVDEKPRAHTNADLLITQNCEYGDLRHHSHYQVRVVGSNEQGVFCCDKHLQECIQQLQERGF